MNGNMMNGNMMNGNMMCSYASGPMDFCGGSMMFSPANQQFRGMEFAMERKVRSPPPPPSRPHAAVAVRLAKFDARVLSYLPTHHHLCLLPAQRVRTACVSCHERKLRCIMQPNGKCQVSRAAPTLPVRSVTDFCASA